MVSVWIARVMAILAALAALLAAFCWQTSSSRGERIEALEKALAKAERDADAVEAFAARMEEMHDEQIERVGRLEKAMADAAGWRDCALPPAVSECLCDGGEAAAPAKTPAPAVRPIEVLR